MFEYNASSGIIKMYGEIGAEISADDFAAALEKMDGQAVTIKLQSEGGSVFDGMRIANAIGDYPGHVRVEIDAFAASIATVFPMRADVVAAYDNSILMIHKAWTVASGNADEFRDIRAILDVMDRNIAKMYAGKTGRSVDKILALMSAETMFDTEQAAELGLIDEIIGIRAEAVNLKPLAVFGAEMRNRGILQGADGKAGQAETGERARMACICQTASLHIEVPAGTGAASIGNPSGFAKRHRLAKPFFYEGDPP